MTPRHPLPRPARGRCAPLARRVLAAAISALIVGAMASPLSAAAATGVATDPNDGVPRTSTPVTYTSFPPVTDPGAGSSAYFQPKWYDTDGRHIQAHGGQIVTAEENGQKVFYWYGEDRTNGYWNSPGVTVYRSTDAMNWTNLGDALRTITKRDDLLTPYFANLYGTVDANGQPRTDRIDALAHHLNTQQSADDTAIFERPKVLYNAKNKQWVMWWHADGRIAPGGSTYARSMAGVAVSDSPAGPFRMVGAYRMPNRTDYQACTSSAVPGQARDMTVFQDRDGKAYISYSSEENYSLYIAALDDSYTNVTHTTDRDTLGVHQYSEDGRFPVVFADGGANAPVRGTDFQIVKECGHLEAPAIFERDGTYGVVASGATGWAPNPQTYYTAQSLMGTWIRGVEPNDANETVAYNAIPDGGDGLLSIGDANRTTFGSQATNVFELEPGKFVYMGDRWNEGKSDSTYVWLPLTVGENGRIEMHDPAAEDPARYGSGWDASYWDDKGFGHGTWKVVDDGLPQTVRRGSTPQLPSTVSVDSAGTTGAVAVAWSAIDTTRLGPQTITGTLAGDAHFAAGRSFTRTVTVGVPGLADIAPEATVTASSRNDLVGTIVDGNPTAKGWDDWSAKGYPRDSWLSFDWGTDTRTFDSVVVHTYKDGATATWPSRIEVQYRDATGAWVTSSAAAALSQDASSAAPVATIDVRSLPASTALRLRLTSVATTWQSISEVDVWGNASVPNVCRAGRATVSASFWQTRWATMPPANACDGRPATFWSTWADAGLKDSATFTIDMTEITRIDQVSFTNVEGRISAVTAEYRTPSDEWKPVAPTGATPTIANGTRTTLTFAKVLATGLRLTFQTPGSYLKIPEILVPEAGGVAAMTPIVADEANAAGWHQGPVSVRLSHDGGADVIAQHRVDQGAWLDGATFDVSSDGIHTVDYRALVDGAPVDGVGGTLTVRIDTVAPVTTATTSTSSPLQRVLAAPALLAATAPAAVTASFSASDATSGVAATEYSLDGGQTWTAGTSVTATGTAPQAVLYRSTDLAGNVETARSVTLAAAAAPAAAAPGDTGSERGVGSAGSIALGASARPSVLAGTGIDLPLVVAWGALIAAAAGSALLLLRRRRA